MLEFYQCLYAEIHTFQVDYEKRQRNILIETDLGFAMKTVDELVTLLLRQNEDVALILHTTPGVDLDTVSVSSSYYRELAYNIEHAIHHFAIIKIAVQCYFKEIQLTEEFGVAVSTIKHLQHCAP